MRRIRLTTRPSVLFGAMLFLALIVLLPMRIVLGATAAGEEGLSARRVSGSIWDARLREARFGDVVLGDVKARLSPFALLIGRARLVFSGPGGVAPPLEGAAEIGRHLVALDDVTARLPVVGVFNPLPVASLDLEGVSVRFRDETCESADGRVRAVMATEDGVLPLPPTLSGMARCDAGALLLPLTGTSGTEGVTLRIRPDGRYTADLTLAAGDAATIERLGRLGFAPGPGGYRLSVQGRF